MYDTRDYLFDLIEELDATSVRTLAKDLVYWLSVDDAEWFCRTHDLLIEDEEENA